MKPESGGLLLIVILIISGLQAIATPASDTTGPSAPPKAPQIKPTEQKTDNACYRSFERLLEAYTTLKPTASRPGDQGPKLEFLVATVPDPIDSQMGWHFDLQLDAIQRAIEGSGYVVDRYSLPWSCVPVEAIRGNSAHRLYEDSPGIVIFRSKGENDPRLLALFLVGETPTSGIHKRAFESAMNSIRNVWMNEKRPTDAPARQVRLLGPTFSGSVKSLKGIIDSWWKEHASKDRSVAFRIISGSASNTKNKEELERAVEGASFVRFEATVIPDNVLIERLVDYLNDLGVDHHKVAVLTESNTGYGSGLQQDMSCDIPKPEAPHSTGECGAGCWLSIPFPMHISKTRSAYEKSLPLKDQYNELLGKAGDQDRTVLPLSLDESGNPRDVLPALASTTPLYDELVLSSTLSTISRSGFRYIGLLATDTKDKLFLARQVRKYCPDVRLFTLESDILYSHPTYSFFMEGTIVVSTYSLFNKNQVWSLTSTGRQKRLQFPNNGAQGVYNATLALLDRKAEMIEYATPFKRYDAASVTRPSVWISTVGRDGLWPLRFYGDYDDHGYVLEGMAPSGSRAGAGMSRRMHLGFAPFLLVLLSIYSLACCFGYLRVFRHPPDEPLPQDLRALDLFRPRHSARRQRSQNRHLLVFFLALTLLYTWLGTLFLIPRAYDLKTGSQIHVWEQLYIAGMIYSALVLALTTLAVSLKVASSEKRFIRLLLLKGARVRRALKRLPARRKRAKRELPIASFLRIPPVKKGKTVWGKSRPVRVTTTAAGLVAVYVLTFVFAVPYLSSMVETVLVVYRQPGRIFSRPVQIENPDNGSNRAAQAQAGLLAVSLPGEGGAEASGAEKDEPLIIDTAMLLSERARDTANGVSPVFPVLALAAGLCLWSLCALRRLRLAETVTTASPFATGGLASAGVTRLETQVRQTLENSFKTMPKGLLPLVMIVLTGIPCFVISLRFLSTFEGPVFDSVFLGAFFLMHAAIALTFFQFISLWHRMKQLLRRLALHPTVGAYDRLPARLSRQVGEQFWAGSPTVADQVFSVQQWLLLCSHFNARIKHQARSQLNIPEDTIKRLEELMRDGQTQTMREGFADELGEHSLQNISRGKTQRTLSSAAGALVEMLEHYWKSRGLSSAKTDAEPLKADSIPAGKATTELYKRDVLDAVDIWFRLAEEFIAIQVVTFINQVFVHLRALLTFITVGSLLLLLTITYYPFQPQRLMTLFIWSCILSIVLASLVVFIQASRNEVMSRIAGTAANRVTFDRTFITMVVTYGVLPLVGLLITQFPQMLRFFSWIEPALRAFK